MTRTVELGEVFVIGEGNSSISRMVKRGGVEDVVETAVAAVVAAEAGVMGMGMG
jgi:hypothetical protein